MKPVTARVVLALALGLAAMPAAAHDGFIGVYGDAAGTQCCANIPGASTLYIIATTGGATSSGITGVEFRLEVTNPAGWFFVPSLLPPTVLGSVMDTQPLNAGDGSGANAAWGSCQPASAPSLAGDRILLGTLTAINAGGGPTELLVKAHSRPSSPSFTCPLFSLCDKPTYTLVCMTAREVDSKSEAIVFRTSINNPACNGSLCAPVSLQQKTWSSVKELYR